MSAGAKNHYLAYQTATETVNALRQRVKTWATASHHWAEIRSPNGREALDTAQLQAKTSHVLVTWHPGTMFDPSGRFVAETGEVYNVVAATDPDGRRIEAKVYAIRNVTPGEPA